MKWILKTQYKELINKKLILWNNTQDWQIIKHTNQKKKKEDTNL
jgi:hypothetical protein